MKEIFTTTLGNIGLDPLASGNAFKKCVGGKLLDYYMLRASCCCHARAIDSLGIRSALRGGSYLSRRPQPDQAIAAPRHCSAQKSFNLLWQETGGFCATRARYVGGGKKTQETIKVQAVNCTIGFSDPDVSGWRRASPEGLT